MFKERRQSHELSDRHYRQVLCRPRALREEMQRVWAITWRPGGRFGSFLGNLFRPIGSPLMMVQVSHQQESGREQTSLLGIAAQVRAQDGTVSYDSIRMRHDFGRLPFVGAKGTTLDPSDDQIGRRSHGSWLRLALYVDQIRLRALHVPNLPEVPQLPRIFFGYRDPSEAPFEVTPALRRRAQGNEHDPNSGRIAAAIASAREESFASLPEEAQGELLKRAWQNAFLPPTDPLNTTGLWLLPQELSRNVFATTQIFEYFGDLVGAHVYNPARDLGGRCLPNPAVALAADTGFDLVKDLQTLAQTLEGDPAFQKIEERLLALIPAVRNRIKASSALSDQQILDAICDCARPIVVEPPLQSLSEGEQLERMKSRLRPEHRECCTDADLLEAVCNPNKPLLASGLCKVQALRREIDVPADKGLVFDAEQLGRDPIQAQLALPAPERAATFDGHRQSNSESSLLTAA